MKVGVFYAIFCIYTRSKMAFFARAYILEVKNMVRNRNF